MPKKQQKSKPQLQPGADVLVHYYPGKSSGPSQATRYIGEGDELRLPTGEKARTKKPGLPLFSGENFYFPKMKEIETNTGNNFFAKLIHWFKCIPSFIKHWWYGINVVKGDKPNHDNHTYDGFAVNSNMSSLGQQTDIDEFINSNDEINKNPELSQKSRVYFGVSRGGTATFSALAKVPMQQEIKLCVLEGPPSSLSGLFKNKGERYFRSRAFGKWFYHKFHTFYLGKKHKIDKKYQARGHVSEFPNNIPLLIISSKKDSTVPHENTIRLALRVAAKRKHAIEEEKKNDVAPVYFLQLDEVDHNYYATSGKQDSVRYLNTLHAICRKHKLDHIAEYADQGESEMRAASLLTPAYSRLMGLQSDFWNTKDSKLRNKYRAEAKQCLSDLKVTDDIDTNPDVINRVISVMHEAPLFAKKLRV